jgi:hypothetical protein
VEVGPLFAFPNQYLLPRSSSFSFFLALRPSSEARRRKREEGARKEEEGMGRRRKEEDLVMCSVPSFKGGTAIDVSTAP